MKIISFLTLAFAMPAMALRGSIRTANTQEIEAFESIMQRGLKVEDKVTGGGGGKTPTVAPAPTPAPTYDPNWVAPATCHDCDCFTCGDVNVVNINGEEMWMIDINHCKSGETISWMCCSFPGNCNTNCGAKKCNTIKPEQLKLIVEPGTTEIEITTHDGQTSGFATVDTGICEGTEVQGGNKNCLNPDPSVAMTNHCKVRFEVAKDCTISPTPPPTPRPTPPPGETDPPTPKPTSFPTIDPNPPTPQPTPNPTRAPIPQGPTRPQVEGDPHVKTWNGKWFDYMGECDLKMLGAPMFDGHQDLTINIRTKIQYDYSYIEAAAIQIGEDVLEVGEYGDFAVNGVDTPYLGGKAGRIGGYDLVHTEVSKKKHTYDIILGPGENITLASYKQLVSVTLNVDEKAANYFVNSEGLLGSYSGDLLARDKKTIMEDTDAFGQEWQVRSDEALLFRAAREPQHPAKCVMPEKTTSEQRRLAETVSEEAAETACSHKKGAAFRNCVYDVMAIGDLELAEAGTF